MKVRADILVVERGLAPTRSQAQALVMAGRVFWGEQRIDKAGSFLPADAELAVREGPRFVSRGGIKLDGALDALGLDVGGAVCVDIGASTGGFTDCLLQHGAARVFAVDVGQGLLAPTLRQDARVTVMERTNARTLQPEAFDAAVELVVVDASFISLQLLLPAICRVLGSGGQLLTLVKPQFEVGRREAGRGRGVVRDPRVREAAIAKSKACIEAAGFVLVGACDSALAGPKGNLEHFVLARRTG